MAGRSVALVVISDRPPDLYLHRCLASLKRFADYPFRQTILIADQEHRWTASGAVNESWSRVNADVEFVFSVEEDFLFTEPVDIDEMATVLDGNPDLAQLVLQRQPWNWQEIEAGGVLKQWGRHAVTDRETAGFVWLEHRRLFCLNPCLVPRRVFERGFPEGSERGMTDVLLSKGYHFGFWGRFEDAPRCHHIGEIKAAGGVP